MGNDQASRASRRDLLPFLVGLALASLAVLTALQPLREYDTWWHLRTGQWVADHGIIPTTDPFTRGGDELPWIAYSWLFGVVLFGLYQLLGLLGILLFRVVLALAIVAALHRLVTRRGCGLIATAALLAAATVALTPTLLGERPWLVTILFCTLTLETVFRFQEGRTTWLVWLLPVLYAIWANIHIQFVHGLFLLGLACAGPVLDRILRRGAEGRLGAWSPAWWQLVLLTGACTAATLCNPYHVRLYSVVLAYVEHKEMYELFPELMAPAFRQPADWVLLGLACAGAFALGRRTRLPAFDVLLLASGAYFAFHSRHDAWFLVLAAVGLAARTWGDPAQVATRLTLNWGQRGIIFIVLAVLAAGAIRQRRLTEAGLRDHLAQEFPVQAVAVLKERHYPGPLYNPVDWGGYLLWHVPELPANIDGRGNLHGGRRLKRVMGSCNAAPDWREDTDLAAARVVLLSHHAPLAEVLRLDPRFAVAHEDDVAVLFVAQRR